MWHFRWNVQIAVHLVWDIHVSYQPHSSRHYYIFFANLTKNRYNFDRFTKKIVVITYPFCSKVTFKKNQVSIHVSKDFWYQELTNQMQSYYAMWPIGCNCIIWPIYLWFNTSHSHPETIVLAVVIFIFDKGKEVCAPD